MQNGMTKKEALIKLQAICSKQEKCTSDIVKKLNEWEVPEETAQEIVNALILDKFVDDVRYANAFVKDKFRFNRWGKIKIVSQLRFKKIDEDIIENALKEIEEPEYKKFVLYELTKKRKSIKDDDKYKIKAKLIRFGQSKGIEMEELIQTVNELLG